MLIIAHYWKVSSKDSLETTSATNCDNESITCDTTENENNNLKQSATFCAAGNGNEGGARRLVNPFLVAKLLYKR